MKRAFRGGARSETLNPDPVTELPLTPPAEEDEEEAAIAPQPSLRGQRAEAELGRASWSSPGRTASGHTFRRMDEGSEGQDGAASAAPERPGCPACVGELPAPTVGIGTEWSHPKSKGNPCSDPSEFLWEFIQSVHRNNKVQFAGLNPLAFSCPGTCPAPQGHTRRGFFPLLPPLVSRSTNREALLPHKTWKAAGLPVPAPHPARSHAVPNLQQLLSAPLQTCFGL